MNSFDEVWLVDFEFTPRDAEPPIPICVVAKDIRSDRVIRRFGEELVAGPPYRTDAGVLFVAYSAAAEVSCHLALGWSIPERVVDLFAEFRARTNGRNMVLGTDLPGALAWFGLPSMDAAYKTTMRTLAMRGAPFTASERAALLDYCQGDVEALAALWPHLAPHTEAALARAMLRGRYMVAVAGMERTGVPLDTAALRSLTASWDTVREALITEVDRAYGVYVNGHFSERRFADYLVRQGIEWPVTPTGRLALDEETFRDMAQVHPVLGWLKELRASLGKLRLTGLLVGQDGRNRVHLAPFQAKTGRNQPSTSRFIFGPAVWLRGLVRPVPGTALAYIDYCQQEFGIAAYLSGDPLMIAAYRSGDPYMTFAVQAGLVPAGATKQSHPHLREMCKQCALAVQYGMGPASLGLRLDRSPAHARELLDLHRRTYRQFWRWSDRVVDHAMLFGHLYTAFEWSLWLDGEVNTRSLRNFPMQANGAEMLRLACCFATEEGVRVCAPIHDALLIEAPVERVDEQVRRTQQAMAKASALVLGGPELRSDPKDPVRHPARYMDERGQQMWDTVWQIIGRLPNA